MEGKIILLVGRSGSGKDAIARGLEKYFGLRVLSSYTTRAPRFDGETTHEFVPSLNLWKWEHPDDYVVAYTEFDGQKYWASGSQIEGSDLYIVDMDGVRYLREHYRGNKKVVMYYVDVDPLTCFRRMLKRGDGVWNALRRVLHDYFAFRGAKTEADYVIHNEMLDECVGDIAFQIRTGTL